MESIKTSLWLKRYEQLVTALIRVCSSRGERLVTLELHQNHSSVYETKWHAI